MCDAGSTAVHVACVIICTPVAPRGPRTADGMRCNGLAGHTGHTLKLLQVCSRLGLVSLGYLWHQPQDRLLEDMIASDIEAVLVKVRVCFPWV